MRLVVALAFTLPLLAQTPGPKSAQKEWAQKLGRGEGRLHVGDPAPDFTLAKAKSTETVQLSQLTRTRPVALIFGSYT